MQKFYSKCLNLHRTSVNEIAQKVRKSLDKFQLWKKGEPLKEDCQKYASLKFYFAFFFFSLHLKFTMTTLTLWPKEIGER